MKARASPFWPWTRADLLSLACSTHSVRPLPLALASCIGNFSPTASLVLSTSNES